MTREAWTVTLARAIESIRSGFDHLSPRDQRALRIGGGAVALIVIVGGLVTLNLEAARAASTLSERRSWMTDLPTTLDRIQRQQRLAGDLALPPEALLQRLAGTRGLQGSLDTSDERIVRWRVEGAPFDAVVDLLADLDTAPLDVQRAHITRPAEGRVTLDLAVRSR